MKTTLLTPVAVTTAVFLFSVFLISPVLAATGATQIVRNNGVHAFAFIPGPVGQFSNIFLAVVKSNAGTDISFRYNIPNIGGGNGFLTTTANVFQTYGLSSATLSPVTLNVCVAEDFSGNCLQTLPVTIQATWTGFGSPTSFGVSGTVPSCNFFPNNIAESGDCGSVSQVGGTSRQATVTGTLNDQSLGQTSGVIGNFRALIISLPPSTVHLP